MKLWREIAPVEHGAWGLFIIPLALGAVVSRHAFFAQVLLGTSTLGVFLMRRPALHWLRAFNRESLDAIHTLWPGQALAVCLGITLAGAIPLLCMGRFYLIFVSALAGALMWSEVFLTSGRERYPFLSQVVEAWVLSLLAPSAYYVGTGRLDTKAAILWMLCAIYFTVSIADIRVRLGRFRLGRGLADEAQVREREMERLVSCWVAMAGVFLIMTLAPGYRIALLSLAPLFLRPFFRQRMPVSVATDIPSLGWSEVYLSLVFAGLAAWLI